MVQNSCMVGVHEEVSDKPDSFPDHTEINSTAVMALSINLKAQCRKCRAEVKCCLMIQHDFTAGLVTCSLLTLVITSPEDIVFINSQEIIWHFWESKHTHSQNFWHNFQHSVLSVVFTPFFFYSASPDWLTKPKSALSSRTLGFTGFSFLFFTEAWLLCYTCTKHSVIMVVLQANCPFSRNIQAGQAHRHDSCGVNVGPVCKKPNPKPNSVWGKTSNCEFRVLSSWNAICFWPLLTTVA